MIVVYGGTFDPVHLGHIGLAKKLSALLMPAEFRFMPCYMPVHKTDSRASAGHRMAMLEMVCRDLNGCSITQFKIDDREVRAQKPVYTVDSIQQIRRETVASDPTAIVFAMGADSFCRFLTWKNWQKILQLAHVAVVSRPGWNSAEYFDFPADITERMTTDHNDLTTATAGRILLVSDLDINVSSSMVRASKSDSLNLLPEQVHDYILAHGLYNNHLN